MFFAFPSPNGLKSMSVRTFIQTLPKDVRCTRDAEAVRGIFLWLKRKLQV